MLINKKKSNIQPSSDSSRQTHFYTNLRMKRNISSKDEELKSECFVRDGKQLIYTKQKINWRSIETFPLNLCLSKKRSKKEASPRNDLGGNISLEEELTVEFCFFNNRFAQFYFPSNSSCFGRV